MTKASAAVSGSRTMFGEQCQSKRPSAPAYGFGTASREHANKLYMSKDHAKLSSGHHSPGPSVYTLRGSVGTQADGRKISSANWSFGTSERFTYDKKSAQNPGPGTYSGKSGFGGQTSSKLNSQPAYGFGSSTRDHTAKCFVSEDHNKARHGIESPGPMVYKLKGAFGKQDASRAANQPAWVFSSTNRFKYDHVKRAATSPGPGSYTLGASVGPQVASTKTSAPAPGFGTSDRDQAAKLYLSPEHEKLQAGVHSPGPMAYTLQSSTGKQSTSKMPTASSWGFGTAKRWGDGEKYGTGKTPGPGAYVV